MPPDGWVLDFGNLVLLEYFVNCTGGGRYVCLLIFKRLFCMATTDAGEILPPLHSCSLSEVCQPQSRLSAEPFRLIHSFIIRSSAAQDEPPHPTPTPPTPSLSACLCGAADRWAGRCAHWSKMNPPPPPGPRFARLDRAEAASQPSKVQRRTPCSGAATGVKMSQRIMNLFVYGRRGFTLITRGWKEDLLPGEHKDRGRQWINEPSESLGLSDQSTHCEGLYSVKSKATRTIKPRFTNMGDIFMHF